MNQDKQLYFTGCHGSGKSTLIRALIDSDPDRFEISERPSIPKSTDPFDRLKLRAVRYYFQTFCAEQRAEETGKIQLWDRCAHDNFGYVNGFANIGWLNPEQVAQHEALYQLLYVPNRIPARTVFVDPSIDNLKKNIQKRWEETGRVKWREDEFQYLEAVHLAMRDYFSIYEGDQLHLTEAGIEESVKKVLDWY